MCQLENPLTDAVLNDLQEVLDPMQPPGMALPVFMGGQSMGGMLTILTVLRNQVAWQVHELQASLSENGLFALFTRFPPKASCLQVLVDVVSKVVI